LDSAQRELEDLLRTKNTEQAVPNPNSKSTTGGQAAGFRPKSHEGMKSQTVHGKQELVHTSWSMRRQTHRQKYTDENTRQKYTSGFCSRIEEWQNEIRVIVGGDKIRIEENRWRRKALMSGPREGILTAWASRTRKPEMENEPQSAGSHEKNGSEDLTERWKQKLATRKPTLNSLPARENRIEKIKQET
jgi:hypothetical protein